MTNLRSQNFLEAVWGRTGAKKNRRMCCICSSGTTSSFGFHYTSGNKTLSESSHPRLTSSKTVAASNTTTTWRPFSRLWRFSSSARAPLNIHIQQAALYSLALISQQKQYQKFEIESIYFNLFDFISKLEICEDLLTPECFFARIRIIKPNYCPQKIQKNNGDSKDNILCIWGIFLNKNCKQILTGAKQKDEISSTM